MLAYSHVQQMEQENTAEEQPSSLSSSHVEVPALAASPPSTISHLAHNHHHHHNNDDDDESSYSSPVTFVLSPVILCILVAEVGERFCFFGFRAVLTLYFVNELNYTEHGAVAYFAYTTALAYLSPVLGALLADGQWGRYHTILVFGFIYLIGMCILTDAAWTTSSSSSDEEEEESDASATATTTVDHVEMRRFLTFVGLFLVCTGTGGIKPCVSAFGADQISLRGKKKKAVDSNDNNEYSIMNDSAGILHSPQKEQQGHYDDDHHHEESETPMQSPTASNGIAQPSSPSSPAPPPAPTDNVEYNEEESYDASSHASSLSAPSARRQVREFFGYFYVCINVGALLSIAIIPIVRSRWGYGPAFGLSALFFFISMLLFLSKRNDYVHHIPGQDGSSLSTTFSLCWWLLIYNLYHHQGWFRTIFPFCKPGRFPSTPAATAAKAETRTTSTAAQPTVPGSRRQQLRQGNGNMMIPITGETAECSPEDHYSVSSSSSTSSEGEIDDITRQQLSDAAQALHVLPILAMLPLFWSLYDQQGSIWTLQATRMKLFGWSAEQLCTINPLEIMIFVPLFSRVIYPALQARGISIAPLRRMRWGFFLTAVSFSISGLLESKIEKSEEGTINVFWQLPQLTILAVAEIFVSVTGLEFAYTKSPDRLKAFIMAIFFLTTAAGNLVSGVLYSSVFMYLTRAMIMHVCALLMLANLGLFYFVSTWWQHREAHQLLPRGMGISSLSRRTHEGIELAASTRVV